MTSFFIVLDFWIRRPLGPIVVATLIALDRSVSRHRAAPANLRMDLEYVARF